MPKTSSEKRIQWEARIRQQRESGMSIEKWCREQQLASHVFHYWKDQLFPRPHNTRASFVELSHEHGAGISIEWRGMRILIDKTFDPTTLRNCLAALGVRC